MGDDAAAAGSSVLGRVLEEVRSALNEHADVVVSSELRTGFTPAVDSFVGFFHVVDWKEPWLISVLTFHAILLLVTIISRRNINFQLILAALTWVTFLPITLEASNSACFASPVSGVFLAERLNTFLRLNWKRFSTQNYFDPQGLFVSVIWSGPLLLITIFILVNTLVTPCMLMVRWKRVELRHRARDKQD